MKEQSSAFVVVIILIRPRRRIVQLIHSLNASPCIKLELVGYLMHKKEICIFETRTRRYQDSFDVQLKEIRRVHLIITRV